ncbi:hypothetical protein FUT69_03710 [Xylella taiwanensis]|uniref:Uncharacterized protein n=1 Tax=Xylella taiwanensis TaxID=1444770 RepID=Z9JGM4_9GAMM|nr:hypothetical protein [Xylella taiwanensis]AXI83709.1 hypothetical protein AB672_07090 [Xylella taiwanensis]EWS76961.1 hypothetical protein AF72_13355 [Xylella taiwanensis]MCD8456807.1 hypothetical protein [Xylella taiwanensis]MCD8459217.1 hypothetical protein [Xylella taiwanensis]MCD8462057.1 hypothetical protein [Xylella taiwanensis]
MNTEFEFQNVEEAYHAIAEDLMAFPGERAWDEVVGKYEVYPKMVSCRWWLVKEGCVDRKWIGGSDEFHSRAFAAVLYLKDDLIKSGGDRIWGLTCTIRPNGDLGDEFCKVKFNIEYDYNKPEDYDESDEFITGEEANQSLRNLFG